MCIPSTDIRCGGTWNGLSFVLRPQNSRPLNLKPDALNPHPETLKLSKLSGCFLGVEFLMDCGVSGFRI